MPDLAPVHNPRKTKHITDKQRAKRRSAKRLYATNHTTWRKLRAVVLREEPLCRQCQKDGRLTPANEVDHIDEDSFNNNRSNLQALCKPCHAKKTAQTHGFQPNE